MKNILIVFLITSSPLIAYGEKKEKLVEEYFEITKFQEIFDEIIAGKTRDEL